MMVCKLRSFDHHPAADRARLPRAARRIVRPLAVATVWLLSMNFASPSQERPTVPLSLHLLAEEAIDQDDMCIWIHPRDRARSTVISADKKANMIFVYDLEGTKLQAIPVPKPGNIDIRYGFPLAGRPADIVAVLQREQGTRIVVFAVDPESRRLRRVDDDAILTGGGKGGTLYRSRRSDKLFFFKTAEDEGNGGVEQYELFDDGSGRVKGRKVRQWDLAGCESAVADDEGGKLFLAEELRGIWEVGAEPDDPVPGKLVIKTGEHGLRPDVEGLAIYRRNGERGYLIVSNQSRDEFLIYDRVGSHRFIGAFTLEGVTHPDGIEVVNVDLGPGFGQGLFVTHSEKRGSDRCPVLVASWESVARAVGLPASIPGPADRPRSDGATGGAGEPLGWLLSPDGLASPSVRPAVPAAAPWPLVVERACGRAGPRVQRVREPPSASGPGAGPWRQPAATTPRSPRSAAAIHLLEICGGPSIVRLDPAAVARGSAPASAGV